ncbi:unnamed protein product, partial [Prorocentrum cordatum]
MKVEYGTGWEDYLTSAEWEKILQESHDTLSWSIGKKGVGKGKGKDQQRARRTKPNVCWHGSQSYQPAVTEMVETGTIKSLFGAHERVKAAAESSGETTTGRATAGKAWDTAALGELRQTRRDCSDRHESARLSNMIATDTRRLLRKWQTDRQMMSKFEDLGQLRGSNAEPAKTRTSQRPAPRHFADVLEGVYSCSELPHELGDASLLGQIPDFGAIELRRALWQLSGGRCADKHGVVWEIIAKSGASLHKVLLGIFNRIQRRLLTGSATARKVDESYLELLARLYSRQSGNVGGQGLSMNGSKTQILTTESEASDSDAPLLAHAGEFMVEILRRGATHKYLGRLFSGGRAPTAPRAEWSQVRQLARDKLLRTVDSGSAPLVAQLAAYSMPDRPWADRALRGVAKFRGQQYQFGYQLIEGWAGRGIA